MSLFDYLTTEQVAQKLGVTSARVRQLSAAGDLPRGRSLPGMRGSLYSRAAINAWRQERTTGLADRLPALAQPVDLVLERIHGYRTWTGLTVPLHVRHYRGPDREVVLLSSAHDHQIITNNVERIVEHLLEQEVIVTDDPMDIVWVSLTPAWLTSTTHTQGTDIANVVLRRDDDNRWTAPSWVHLTWAELRDLLGHDVDTYLWEHYTPEIVTAWLRRRPEPVRVVDDPEDVRGDLQSLQYMHLHTEIPAGARQLALNALAKLVELKVGSFGYRQLPRPAARDERPPTTMTLEAFALGDEDQALVEQHLPPEDLDHRDVEAGARQLVEYGQAHDENSPRPDREITRHVDAAVRAAITLHTLVHPEHERLRIRDPHADVTADVVGSWDRQYLAACTWDEHALTSRQSTILRRGWGEWPEYSTRVGVGPDGTPVAEILHQDKTTHMLRFLWPTQPLPAQDVADDIVLVADGAGGDRPVYLTRKDAIVALLPRERPLGQWNFGYGGGGPGALIGAIVDLLEHAGVDVDGYRRGLIELEVHQSSQDHLRIPLSRILTARA